MALGRHKCQEMKVHSFLMISDFRKAAIILLESSQTLPVFPMLRAALKTTMRWANGGKIIEEKAKVPGGKQRQLEIPYHKSNTD